MSRILVIEDNKDNARLAEKVLKRAGHDVVIAADGEDGLQNIFTDAPQLVLLDMGLPDIDGQTVVAILRQHEDFDTLPIIAFTAWPQETASEMAKAYGCDGVIPKPINTRTFAEQVEAYLKTVKQ